MNSNNNNKNNKNFILFIILLITTIIIIVFSILNQTLFKYYPNNKPLWSFQRVFGLFNEEIIQDGFLKFQDNCSSCHTINHISISELKTINLNKEQIKSFLYKNNKVREFIKNNSSDINKIVPPDLSNIIKIKYDGPDYVFFFLIGYLPIKEVHIPNFINNKKYHNLYIKDKYTNMPPPPFILELLNSNGNNEKGIESAKRTAYSITTFLSWVSDSNLNHRKRMGIKAISYLIFLSILFFFAKKKIWNQFK